MMVHMEEDGQTTPTTNQRQTVEHCSVVAKYEKSHRVHCLMANARVSIQSLLVLRRCCHQTKLQVKWTVCISFFFFSFYIFLILSLVLVSPTHLLILRCAKAVLCVYIHNTLQVQQKAYFALNLRGSITFILFDHITAV